MTTHIQTKIVIRSHCAQNVTKHNFGGMGAFYNIGTHRYVFSALTSWLGLEVGLCR